MFDFGDTPTIPMGWKDALGLVIVYFGTWGIFLGSIPLAGMLLPNGQGGAGAFFGIVVGITLLGTACAFGACSFLFRKEYRAESDRQKALEHPDLSNRIIWD